MESGDNITLWQQNQSDGVSTDVDNNNGSQRKSAVVNRSQQKVNELSGW